jgi:hypothetical protein
LKPGGTKSYGSNSASKLPLGTIPSLIATAIELDKYAPAESKQQVWTGSMSCSKSKIAQAIFCFSSVVMGPSFLRHFVNFFITVPPMFAFFRFLTLLTSFPGLTH